MSWSYTQVTVGALREVPGWDVHPVESLAQLIEWVEMADLDPGDLLTREGTQGVRAFLIVDGEADVTVNGAWRATVRAGELVGAGTLSPRRARTATVIARTRMRVVIFDADVVERFRDHPAVRATPGAVTARR